MPGPRAIGKGSRQHRSMVSRREAEGRPWGSLRPLDRDLRGGPCPRPGGQSASSSSGVQELIRSHGHPQGGSTGPRHPQVDPGTGEVLMHLFSRPPVPMSRGGHKRTPASTETGVRIGMVAGAGFAALEKTRTRRWIWDLPFERLGRALDAMWEDAKLRFRPVGPARKGR